MKKLTYIFVSIVALASFFSCKKGATGPDGPAGTTGAQGASMVYTIDTVTVLASQWHTSATLDNYYFDEPYLDKQQSSLVEVYYSLTDNITSVWNQLPLTGAFKAGDKFYFSYDPYDIYLDYIPAAGSAPPNLYFRVIIIPQPQ